MRSAMLLRRWREWLLVRSGGGISSKHELSFECRWRGCDESGSRRRFGILLVVTVRAGWRAQRERSSGGRADIVLHGCAALRCANGLQYMCCRRSWSSGRGIGRRHRRGHILVVVRIVVVVGRGRSSRCSFDGRCGCVERRVNVQFLQLWRRRSTAARANGNRSRGCRRGGDALQLFFLVECGRCSAER